MRPEERQLLSEILTAMDTIAEYLGPRITFRDFQKEKILRRAVERELETIDLANKRLLTQPSDVPSSEARTPVKLRSWVTHSYEFVDAIVVWAIVHKDLPILRKQVVEWMNQADT